MSRRYLPLFRHLAIFLFFLFCYPEASADEARVYFGIYYLGWINDPLSIKSSMEFGVVGVKGDFEIGRWKGYAEGLIQFDRSDSDIYSHKIDLWETYLTTNIDNFRIDAGNRIYNWGVSSFGSILNFTNPPDMRIWGFLTEKPGARLPIPSIDTEYFWGSDSSLEILFSPVFVKPRFDFLLGRFSLMRLVSSGEMLPPPELFEFFNRTRWKELEHLLSSTEDPALFAPQGGVRLKSSIDDLDFQFGFYNGYEWLPVFSIDGNYRDLNSMMIKAYLEGRLPYSAKYMRRNIFFADATYALEDFNLVMESFFSSRSTLYSQSSEAVRVPALSMDISVEYIGYEDLKLILTVAGYSFFGITSEDRVLFVHDPGGNKRNVDTMVLSGAASYDINDDLNLSLGSFGETSFGSYTIMTDLTYRFSDNIRLKVGAFIFEGDSKRGLFGVFNDSDLFFLSLLMEE